jgi:hypothetical protein
MTMAVSCREYLITDCSNDHGENFARMRELKDTLKEWIDRKIIGFLTRAIYTHEEVIDEDLDPSEIMSVSGGKLPVIWVN